MFYVYILQSETTSGYYVGQTDDLEKRLIEHNSDRKGYTKCRGPWILMYSEVFTLRKEARRRESQIKKIKGRKYIEELIISRGHCPD